MSAEQTAALIAAIASALAVAGLALVVVSLTRRTRELQRLVERLDREVERLDRETVPLVREARVVVDQASTEMERVGDVLGSAEAVSATVDSASRLAYRAFANPMVKVVAYGSGAGSAVRRLFRNGAASTGNASSSAPPGPSSGDNGTPAARNGRARR